MPHKNDVQYRRNMRMAQVYTETCWKNYHDQFNLRVSFNLADLSNAYGLPAFSQHDALQDSLQTAYLFIYLTKKLKVRGLIPLKDLFNAGQSWEKIFRSRRRKTRIL